MRFATAALFVAVTLCLFAGRAAAAPVLQSVQTQQVPNGHVRVLLQFLGYAVPRPSTAMPTTTFGVQFPGAQASATVPTLIPVNLGALQTITVGQFGLTLNINLNLAAPLRPTISSSNGYIIIDVPPATGATAGLGAMPGASALGAPYGAIGPQQFKIIKLHYADVSEIVGILTSTASITPSNQFQPQASQLGSQPITYGGFGTPALPATTLPTTTLGGEANQALGQRINDNVAIDRRLNSVILSGTPAQIAQAESLIKALDVPVRSVLLDTEVLEVTESGAKSLGFDFNQTPTQPLTRIFNFEAQQLNGLPATAVPGSIALQTNLSLLVSKGGARILASPKILTEDGVGASILTGDSLPIRVNTPVGVGGIGTVASQVEYINVGVNLQILPRVTGDHTVETNIFSQVSSVSGFTANNDPQISTRQAQTRVNLVEGETLVIGGLMQQRDIHNLQKIPVLGDLPLVGALFRFYTETRQNTNLIITISPHIVAAPGETGAQPAAPAPAPTAQPSRSY